MKEVLEGGVTKRYEGLPGARRAGCVYAGHDGRIDMLMMLELEGKCEEVSKKTKSRCSGNCALESQASQIT